MKLNDETIEVLKNFSSINPGVMLRKGNQIKTISDKRNILATANINQELEGDAGIYDLSRFLATVDVLDAPDIKFQDDRFVMVNGSSKVEYTYASENMLVLPPEDKKIQMGDTKATFFLPWQSLQKAIRTGGVMSLTDLHLWSENGTVKLSIEDRSNPTADTFQIDIDTDDSQEEFSVYIKTENVKLLPGDYTVAVSDRIVNFKSDRIEYWIATDA